MNEWKIERNGYEVSNELHTNIKKFKRSYQLIIELMINWIGERTLFNVYRLNKWDTK